MLSSVVGFRAIRLAFTRSIANANTAAAPHDMGAESRNDPLRTQQKIPEGNQGQVTQERAPAPRAAPVKQDARAYAERRAEIHHHIGSRVCDCAAAPVVA